jgi:hypothetical protein
MNWMIFYREKDLQYFLFNGEWPMPINPGAKPWAYDGKRGVLEMINYTTEQKNLLCLILSSKKKAFIIDKTHYVVEQRGKFQIK